MNRYPLWKYVIVAVAMLLGLVYTLPNFFGESPAVQVSSAKATLKVDDKTRERVATTLQTAGVEHSGIFLDSNGVKVRLRTTDSQLQAKDLLEKQFNPDASNPQYVVALNLLSSSPQWLSSLHALPMYLGLDLRGGVHFLLQVDMKGALTKRLDSISGDLRSLLRDKTIRHAGISREGERVIVRFRDSEARNKGRMVLEDNQSDLLLADQGEGEDLKLVATLKPEAVKRIQEFAIRQNMTTLHNRINELGVAEPVIAQQGADRIVVQLPGVQDTAKAKDILGRTATLEIRMVDETAGALEAAQAGQVPFATELYVERGGMPLLVKKQVVLTGDRLTDAQPGFDNQTQEPAVHLTLDSAGARIFKDITRDNVGKRMAIVLIEKGKGEVVTAPVIRAEIGGGRVQISGRMSSMEANDTALLLRAGSLAAPMDIIEERTIGPSLGADNIKKGFLSTMWGFAAIAVIHDRLLHALRTGLGGCPGFQPAVPGGPALLAAGDADPARNRRHRADAGYGHRRQRPDQRAHPRGTAQWLDAAGCDPHRLRAGLRNDSRFQHHDADCRHRPADFRLRPRTRLRGGALSRDPDLPVLGRGRLARA
jgi:preprotein translocase subunit SecD